MASNSSHNRGSKYLCSTITITRLPLHGTLHLNWTLCCRANYLARLPFKELSDPLSVTNAIYFALFFRFLADVSEIEIEMKTPSICTNALSSSRLFIQLLLRLLLLFLVDLVAVVSVVFLSVSFPVSRA